jgi:hypothetical protein
MLMPAITGLLVGIALAQRFRVPVLAPVILLTLLFAITAVIARADAAWPATMTAALAIVGLQLGYLAGIGLRYLMVVARASRRGSAALPSALPPQHSAH